MATFKGITLAKGWNKSFASFKKEFGNIYLFKSILPEKREAAMKEVYDELMKQTKEEKANKNAGDGNVSSSTDKSEGDNAE